MTILTVLIAAVLCVILVVFVAKKLFASNSMDVPVGLNTATIASAVTNIPDAQEQPAVTTSVTKQTTSETVLTTAPLPEEMYVVTYVQLQAEPSVDAANLICMSPNIKVKVLERTSEGYMKVTFLNCDDTVYTGYVLESFLSPVPVERETTTTAETELFAGE